ncbi:hypothetical protein C5706_32620, partial [Klebsiella pneumoniae]
SAGFSPHTAEGTAAPGQAAASGGRLSPVDCADIWAHSSVAQRKNPLYWLRGVPPAFHRIPRKVPPPPGRPQHQVADCRR